MCEEEHEGLDSIKAAKMDTEQRDREADLLAMLQSTDLSIWSSDCNYNLIFGNASFQQRSVQITGRKIAPGETLLPLDWGVGHVERWQGYYDRVFDGEEFQVRLKRDDIKAELFMDYSFSPIYDQTGEIIGATVIGRDGTDHKKAEEALKRQQDVLFTLATHPSFVEGDTATVVRLITEAVAEALEVGRVSIWLLENGGRKLVCKDMYLRAAATHESGAVLLSEEFPNYFSELTRGRIIDAHDAWTDPRTAEFKTVYLKPNDIVSMLDATIRIQGKVVGAVCLEHLKKKRAWSPEDANFAAQVADQMAQVLAIEDHRQHDELYRAVVEDTPNLICCFKQNGELTFVNRAYSGFFKKSPEALIGSNFLDLIPADTREEVLKSIISLSPEEPTQRNEHPVFDPDGKIKWFRWINRAIFDASGNIDYYHSTGEDTTVQVEVREKLRQSEARYRNVVSSLKEVIFEADIDGNWLFLNEAWANITGFPVEETLGKNYLDYIHPADRKKTSELLKELVDKKKDACKNEVRYLHNEGGYRWIQSHAVLGNTSEENPAAIIGTLADITDRRLATEALQESRRKFSTLLENLPGMVYRCQNDPTWTMELISDGCTELTGYLPSDFIGNKNITYSNLILPKYRDFAWDVVQDAIKEQKPFELEYEIKDRDGKIRWMWEQGSGIFNKKGDLVALEGFITEVTNRKRAEEATELIQSQLRAVLDAVPSYIFAKDYEGRFIMVNQALADVFGYPPEEVIGKTDKDYGATDEQVEGYLKADRQVMDSGLPLFISEEEVMRSDGKTGTFQTIKIPYHHPGIDGPAILGVATEITERRKAENERAQMEEQLRQAQKLEAIGQLTGGIAHDFNNLLQAMNGYTELAKIQMEEGHPAHHALEQVAKAGERGASLVSQLLLFSRRQIMRPEILNINDVISDTVKMLERLIGEHVHLEWKPGQNIDNIYADPTMIGQALINLSVNARDAMPGGGKLAIETAAVEIDKDYITTHSWAKQGSYALLTVSDTGGGIEKEILDRIFEPFFTTKGVGKGTGLGLATVYGIAKQHDGMVNVYSEPGTGSVFKVYWPLAKQEAEGQPDAVYAENKTNTKGQETILLAEDDEAVRQLTAVILESAGYNVLSAASGVEAMEIFEEKHAEIDLVLLDVIMPEMGGHSAWQEMRIKAPQIKALFASGYSEDSIHSDYVLKDGVTLIQKPFTRRGLLEAVRSVLDAEEG